MKKTIIFLFILHLAATAITVKAQNEKEPPEIHDEWRLKKEKEGIRIFTRWIEAEEGRKARQMHALMMVESSMASSVLALTDQNQVKRWLNRADTYYHFDEKDDFIWSAYTEFSIPWPLDNQDLITLNTLTQDPATGDVRITVIGDPGRLAIKKGVQRIPHFDGSWTFQRTENGMVRIDYYIFTNSKPILPRWIVDPIIEYGLWSTFDELRKVIRENVSRKVFDPSIMN